MSMNVHPREFERRLKDVSRAYTHALQRYTQAMQFGETEKADEALSRMQEIEQGVTLIVRPELVL